MTLLIKLEDVHRNAIGRGKNGQVGLQQRLAVVVEHDTEDLGPWNVRCPYHSSGAMMTKTSS